MGIKQLIAKSLLCICAFREVVEFGEFGGSQGDFYSVCDVAAVASAECFEARG